MDCLLEGFDPVIIERVVHRLPKAIAIKSYVPGTTKLTVESDSLSDDEINDLLIRYALDENLRTRLHKETESERKLIYAYALTGLLPEDIDG